MFYYTRLKYIGHKTLLCTHLFIIIVLVFIFFCNHSPKKGINASKLLKIYRMCKA